MKTALLSLVFLALLGGLVWQYTGKTALEAQIAQLQKDNDELPKLREANKELESFHAQSGELTRLRKETAELPKLRNEVRQLRDEKQQSLKVNEEVQQLRAIVQQFHQVQNENAQLRAQTQQLQQTGATQQAVAPPQPATAQDKANACINNLRQLDGATQQWALENKKRDIDRVTLENILPYLPNGFPTCPAGGNYTLSTVANPPTCSVPGHALK